jgi:hypothetical protein
MVDLASIQESTLITDTPSLVVYRLDSPQAAPGVIEELTETQK